MHLQCMERNTTKRIANGWRVVLMQMKCNSCSMELQIYLGNCFRGFNCLQRSDGWQWSSLPSSVHWKHAFALAFVARLNEKFRCSVICRREKVPNLNASWKWTHSATLSEIQNQNESKKIVPVLTSGRMQGSIRAGSLSLWDKQKQTRKNHTTQSISSTSINATAETDRTQQRIGWNFLIENRNLPRRLASPVIVHYRVKERAWSGMKLKVQNKFTPNISSVSACEMEHCTLLKEGSIWFQSAW